VGIGTADVSCPICQSVSRPSLWCIVEKMADWIWMPFGVIGHLGPRMKQAVGVGDCSMARGSFGDICVASHCNQWGLCCIVV